MHYWKIKMVRKASTNNVISGHWKTRKSVKDAYKNYFMKNKSAFEPIQYYPVYMHYNFVFKTRMLDSTNCNVMHKYIEDSLRHINVLKDDSAYECVAGSSITPSKGLNNFIEIYALSLDEINQLPDIMKFYEL